MISLLVGILIVVASAAGFGLALFGRRPVPQPAMAAGGSPSAVAVTEFSPSYDDGVTAASLGGVLEGSWVRRLLAREATADHQPERDVTLSPTGRLRSTLLLGLTVIGLAALLGGMLSVIAVGIVFLAT